MKESEAVKKWCPMSRIVIGNSDDLHDNRQYNISVDTNCIGSGCVWWVWDIEKDWGLNGPTERPIADKEGHCGGMRLND